MSSVYGAFGLRVHLTFWGVLLIAGVTLALSVFVPQATKEHSAPT